MSVRARLPVVAALAAAVLLSTGCGEEPTYTVDDLVAHLETEGVAVEETHDLAEMSGAPAGSGISYLLTLADGTQLLVHVAEDARRARSVLRTESESRSAARRMGVGGADTYSTGATFGNLAVLVRDGTDPARVEELTEVLER